MVSWVDAVFWFDPVTLNAKLYQHMEVESLAARRDYVFFLLLLKKCLQG